MLDPDQMLNRAITDYLDMALRFANVFPAVVDLETGEIVRPSLWDEVVGNPPGTTAPRLSAWVAAIAAEGVRGLALRILVAEDNEFNRDLLEYMLAGQGLSATMVVDGRETLLLAARGADPAMLQKMCRSLEARVPEHLAAVREALHSGNALSLREAAHKFCGMLSAFSTVAGNQAADLEDAAASAQLDKAQPIVAQLEMIAGELLERVEGLTNGSLRHQAE